MSGPAVAVRCKHGRMNVVRVGSRGDSLLYDSPKDAVDKAVKVTTVYEPNQDNHKLYDAAFARFVTTMDALNDTVFA